MPIFHPWRRRRATIVVAAALLMSSPVVVVTPVAAGAPNGTQETEIGLTRLPDEEASVVEILLADTAELDRLVATGVDLDHQVSRSSDHIVAQAVVTPSEVNALKELGYRIGNVLFTPADAHARLKEREETIARHRAENAAFGVQADSDVKIIRADYYTTGTTQVLSVEAKWANGQAQPEGLTVLRDSGPGTEMGSGGSQNISRFVDADVYLYHRGAATVSARPDYIKITSPTGGVATAKVKEWLPVPPDDPEGPGYQKDFVTSYLTPSELYSRIHQLAAEFPDLAEIVQLPYLTNGYRRKAQAVLGAASANRVAIDSLAWGHEGGNGIAVTMADPAAADQPLSVTVAGTDITVTLATDAAGVVTSTAAQVAAALNAQAGTLIRAYTFRGNAGAGVVAPAARTMLSDGLHAPASVSREPQPVYAIRIGKHRDGSKPGVMAYAQEHAREWVPPLVAVETTERLLRNYSHDGHTKQLLDNLDIWIAPSINPDGGHYAFYDFNSQRKNMTNHCPLTGAADGLARNAWGVDNNRNYSEYSMFDGYFGASASCTSEIFAGPGEMSEPEDRNLDWLAARPNITFSMNLHSSGNYFMWSPGSYSVPGRITAPRPTLAEESFFWGASTQILTAIKRHRNMAVTPARTGPISDVLYSAAGNSGDLLWYKYRIFAWNFEVGTSFQPVWAEAHDETMEFANGLVELMRVAHNFATDRQRPASGVSMAPSSTPGMASVWFRVSEPSAIFYTLDGSRPTYSSTLYASAGVREGGETFTLPLGTTIQWFAVDAAGNVENGYQPDGNGNNFRRSRVVLPRG
ncbi:hypothetical protein Rhe02_89080 [Rhizocola hellebori]|uniref:Peptidase M14 domain-containing protein n=1 Tax=Rhizocola hellebori TaxID=1392758 RepID=A0A8J3VM48_9ACTN|nr:M14 family metallopeptidase [Rhizocola hellebori]GIH10841.1 hypothetical protein Rhe02_89080 [Rhizocola hellebori]